MEKPQETGAKYVFELTFPNMRVFFLVVYPLFNILIILFTNICVLNMRFQVSISLEVLEG